MGSADRIERERLAKRARILDAARELFVERGIEAVTLREVAQRIEYSTTAIYVHFKDKQDLIDQMIAEDFASFAAALEATAKIGDPLERLEALNEAYVEFALAMPHHYQLLFLSPPPGGKKAPDAETPAGIQGYRLLRATVDECIRTGRFREELDDPDTLAQVIWGNVHGLVGLQIVVGHAAAFHWRPPAVLAATSLQVLLHGLLRDPSKLRGRKPRHSARLAATNRKR